MDSRERQLTAIGSLIVNGIPAPPERSISTTRFGECSKRIYSGTAQRAAVRGFELAIPWNKILHDDQFHSDSGLHLVAC